MHNNYAKKVFLGGTCADTKWRAEIIPQLTVPYYNPVLKGEWTPEAANAERKSKRLLCSHSLYVITPQMEGAYSIAELVEDSITRKNAVVVCFLEEYDGVKFSADAWRSIEETIQLLTRYHQHVFTDLEKAVEAVNRIA